MTVDGPSETRAGSAVAGSRAMPSAVFGDSPPPDHQNRIVVSPRTAPAPAHRLSGCPNDAHITPPKAEARAASSRSARAANPRGRSLAVVGAAAEASPAPFRSDREDAAVERRTPRNQRPSAKRFGEQAAESRERSDAILCDSVGVRVAQCHDSIFDEHAPQLGARRASDRFTRAESRADLATSDHGPTPSGGRSIRPSFAHGSLWVGATGHRR
jgi:hypothetical protein